MDIIIFAQSQVWFKIVLVFKKTAFSVTQMSITSNLEHSDSLVYFIGHLKESDWRKVCNLSHRLPIHLINYWWVGISNYVCSTISVITKIYIFLLYFASVSLLITRTQLASIAWTGIYSCILSLLKLHRSFCFMS